MRFEELIAEVERIADERAPVLIDITDTYGAPLAVIPGDALVVERRPYGLALEVGAGTVVIHRERFADCGPGDDQASLRIVLLDGLTVRLDVGD